MAKIDDAVAAMDGLVKRCDEWSDESRKAAAEARKGGSSGSNTTKEEATKKIQGASKQSLESAIKHPNTDPKIKKMIEKELDDRGSRGL